MKCVSGIETGYLIELGAEVGVDISKKTQRNILRDGVNLYIK